jgi:hypothetical protein
MPVFHRKTLDVWSFRANIENLTQCLSIINPNVSICQVTSQKILIKDEKYLDNINFVC